MPRRVQVQPGQEEAPLPSLVLLQAGRDSCLLCPHNHLRLQLPLRGFGCLYLEWRPRPVASGQDLAGPALGFVFPLASPDQEEPRAVTIDLKDVLLLTVPKENLRCLMTANLCLKAVLWY